MSFTRSVTLRCDAAKCRETYEGEPDSSVVDVRMEAAETDGWVYAPAADWPTGALEDLCSTHSYQAVQE